MDQSIIPVLLAGGEGRRLWPLSRRELPKQFIALSHHEHSLLQQAALRAMVHAAPEDIITVTTAPYAEIARTQLTALHPGLANHLIIESASRNTAAAIAAAALYASHVAVDPMLWIMPTDQVMDAPTLLTPALNAGTRMAADKNGILLFGVPATMPSQAYGYILADEPAPDGLRPVAQFCEKPEPEVAQSLIRTGHCFWNTGMVMARAEILLAAMHLHAPGIMARVREAYHHATLGARGLKLAARAYDDMPNQPFDRAVLEKSPQVWMLPLPGAWADLGSWESLWQHLPKDEQGNALVGNVQAKECEGSLIFSRSKPIICEGAKGLVVVETEEAVYISRRGENPLLPGINFTISDQIPES